MALETNQDLENFFDTETHGSNATVTINGTGSSIKVIINKEYFAIPGESVDVTGFQPMVHCRSQDITGIDTDDTLTVGGVTYNITEIQDDGTGVTVLILQD